MLGPIPEAFGGTCYVRSLWKDFVMLGPIPEALSDHCYVRPISSHDF